MVSNRWGVWVQDAGPLIDVLYPRLVIAVRSLGYILTPGEYEQLLLWIIREELFEAWGLEDSEHCSYSDRSIRIWHKVKEEIDVSRLCSEVLYFYLPEFSDRTVKLHLIKRYLYAEFNGVAR